MQLPYRTRSNLEEYVKNQEWRDAALSDCPLHPAGGCSFARHGSYARKTSPGVRIARWYCPQSHRTFSLLPDFLAARLPGLLSTVEDSIIVVCSADSLEAAADSVRGLEVTLPAATRWLRRRIRAVGAALAFVVYAICVDAVAMLSASRVTIDDAGVLLSLRRSLSPLILNSLPAPLGFLPA